LVGGEWSIYKTPHTGKYNLLKSAEAALKEILNCIRSKLKIELKIVYS